MFNKYIKNPTISETKQMKTKINDVSTYYIGRRTRKNDTLCCVCSPVLLEGV